ncbi:MAG: FxLYD domain-containing protein [Deltaproteobacteria bacterium]|jgi:hypothetical protein|nr:FxLYD domain-containing protein [Deltaproteobacteria bacterium]
MNKRLAFALTLAFGFFFLACSSAIYVPGEQQAATKEDVANLGPGSLKVEVEAYQWTLVNGGTHIRVVGEVINNTGKSLQSVTLTGVLHDQDGKPIAFGNSYVYPAYLPSGGRGTFEFVGLNKRPRGLINTRLVTNCVAQVVR